jgi:hypothetical protein
MGKTAGAILDVTGVGVHQITIVGQAFGLASSTFTNVNSRLLLEANQSTVQSVVVKNQEDFRNERKYENTDNRSDAIYYLRSYLRLCMPATIETEINTTVSISKRVGPEALKDRPFIAPIEPVFPDVPAGVVIPKAKGPAVAQKGREPPAAVEAHARYFEKYSPAEFPPSLVKKVLQVICAPQADAGLVDETTGPLIAIWEEAELSEKVTPNGVIDTNEKTIILKQKPCPGAKVKNAYERMRFKDGRTTDISRVIELLTKVKIAGRSDLERTRKLDDPEVRTRIAEVRRELEKIPAERDKLIRLPESMAQQWTPDLFRALRAYEARPSPPNGRPPAAPAAPRNGQPPPAPGKNGLPPVRPTIKNGQPETQPALPKN